MRRSVAVLLALVVYLFATSALADPVVHVTEPFHVSVRSGASEDFPPAFIVPEPMWAKVDAELKRLQDQETRLKAENTSLVSSVNHAGLGWGTVLTIGLALVVGAGAEHYL